MNIDCSRHDGSLCIECCKWMTFIIKNSEELEKQLEFYVERGCKMQYLKVSDSFAITIPSVCPHLTVTGCRIYSVRPKYCRDYDCRRDPFLKDGKYFLEAIVNTVDKEVKQATRVNGSTINIVGANKEAKGDLS